MGASLLALAKSIYYENYHSGMLRHGLPDNLHNLAKWHLKDHLKRIVLISRHGTWQTVGKQF